MEINYFIEASHDSLYNDISNNKTNYLNKDDSEWIKKYFSGKEYYKSSGIFVNDIKLSLGKSETDFENTITIYDALKDKITPRQARNVYFWSYLSNIEFYEYTKSRWIKSNKLDEEDEELKKKKGENIKERFFVTSLNGTRNGLFRNSISRLFWYGYLTYQQDGSNPYLLTKVLLSNTDLCVSLTERKFGSNPTIVCGILEAIKEINDDYTKTNVKTEEWRSLTKYLNRYGAVTILDYLSRDEIKELCLEYIKKIRGK